MIYGTAPLLEPHLQFEIVRKSCFLWKQVLEFCQEGNLTKAAACNSLCRKNPANSAALTSTI